MIGGIGIDGGTAANYMVIAGLASLLGWATLKPKRGIVVSAICLLIVTPVVGTIGNATGGGIEMMITLNIMYSMPGIGLMISIRDILRGDK